VSLKGLEVSTPPPLKNLVKLKNVAQFGQLQLTTNSVLCKILQRSVICSNSFAILPVSSLHCAVVTLITWLPNKYKKTGIQLRNNVSQILYTNESKLVELVDFSSLLFYSFRSHTHRGREKERRKRELAAHEC